MKLKKSVIVIVMFTVFVLALTVGVGAKDQPLRIGIMPNNLGAPAAYAQEHHMFKDVGLNVKLIMFPTGAPINEALSAKQLDGALSGLASVYALGSGDCKWVGDIDLTLSGMNIYVRPDSPVLKYKGLAKGKPNVYGNADTIKGLTFLVPLGTASHYNAIMWAKSFDISTNDINVLHMEFGPALQAFISGQGDALPTIPPYNFQAEAKGFVPVADLKEVSGMDLMNGILFRNNVIENRRSDVKKFLKVVYSVIDKFAANDDLYAEFAYKFYNDNAMNYTKEMIHKEINDRDFLGGEYMSRPDYRFGATMLGMGKFYTQSGKIMKEDYPNIVNSMDPSFLEEIYGIDIKVFGQK